MLKPMNRHIYKIIIAVLGLVVVYHLATYQPVILESTNPNTVDNKPIKDPLELGNLAPTKPQDSAGLEDDILKHVAVADEDEGFNADKGMGIDSELDLAGDSESGGSNDDAISPGFKAEIVDGSAKNDDGPSGLKPIDLDNLKDETAKQDSDGAESEVSADILSTIRDLSVFFNGMEKYRIKSPLIKDKYKTEKAKELFSTDTSFLFSKDYIEDVLDIPEETLSELKKSHTDYVNVQMRKLLQEYKISTFGNILKTDPEWKSYEGTQGYVLIGGGRYSWLSYLVIKQIRAIGSTIPIELFIPSSAEYEKEFCEVVLPRYNAHCNVFDDKLAARLAVDFDISGYQYKMLALLSSKFENIIYLDSDNFPVRNPEFILNSELFKETGLVLWPDAWARTTNPKFYDIANVEVKETKLRYNKYDEAQGTRALESYSFQDSWYHMFEGTIPDPTSETGMMIINKTKQLKTLLLSLYYNVYGPNHYYPLMTQGSAGEGDKETFIAAAHVLGEPWFQTLKQFHWSGYKSKIDGKFKSKALGHFDPIQSQTDPDGDLDIVFMHLSYPKYYPNWLVDNHDLIYELGEHIRMYEDIYTNAGYDFDLRVLQYFTQGLCSNYYDSKGASLYDDLTKESEYMGKYLEYVSSDKEIQDQRCEEVFIPHLMWLRETTQFPNLVVQPEPQGDM